MKIAGFAALLIIVCGTSIGHASPTGLLQGEVGKTYSAVRQDLLNKGDVPVSQEKVANRGCDTMTEVCQMYPEVWACATDQGAPCRFEWKARSGQRFYIITAGEDPKLFTVTGMGLDTRYELENSLVENN